MRLLSFGDDEEEAIDTAPRVQMSAMYAPKTLDNPAKKQRTTEEAPAQATAAPQAVPETRVAGLKSAVDFEQEQLKKMLETKQRLESGV
jgi:hypothetical protein